MRIIPGDPGSSARPFVILGGTLAMKLKLSQTTRRVRAGTPLCPTPLGWAACVGDEAPWAFSADYKQPGDEVTAWREITVDLGRVLGVPGTRFRIADVGDDGGLTFELDADGPHAVLWDSLILLTAGHARPAPPPEPLSVEPAASSVVADYQNHPDLEPPLSDTPAPVLAKRR